MNKYIRCITITVGEDIMSSIDLNYSIDTETRAKKNQQVTDKKDKRTEKLTNILMVLSLLTMLVIMIIAAIAT